MWENRKSRYGTYEEFKANWDPDTHVLKTITKEFKADFRKEIKDILGINSVYRTGRGVTSEVERMLRNNRRPFN